MIELIKEIPGPFFLLIYPVYSILIILIAKKIVERDYTKDLELPEPTKLTPLDIALLYNGIKGAVIVSVFNLWRNKKITIKKTQNDVILKQISFNCVGFNKLESVIFKSLNSHKSYRYFFSKKSTETIKNILRTNTENLEKLKLVPDLKVRQRYHNTTLIAMILLLLLGGTKLYLGITWDKPVAFLVILIMLSIVALLYLMNHDLKYSALGRSFLETSSQRFEWLKKTDINVILSDDNLLYGVAVFGISAFIGSTLGQVLDNPVLFESYTGSSSGGSGCGGAGCGGGCSGGCGGGCGGCGGCGG